MFKCSDCESEFYYPEVYREFRGEFWGMPAYEEVGRCPVCGSDEFEEATNEE